MSTEVRTEAGQALRRRMHILERTHSNISARSTSNHDPLSSPPDSFSEMEFEYESPSDTSEEITPRPKTRAKHFDVPDLEPKEELNSPDEKGRAWYQLDYAIVAALVSPVGNLLTGGDVVKNLLYILLLLFYLHQIIEAPWTLYHQSRMRRRAPHIDPDASPSELIYRQKAATELHRYEVFFLFLAALSPFAGAALLRYILTAVAGQDVLTWFSTGLFVLATGIRPWTHIKDRITERVNTLHDVVHYPSANQGLDQMREEMASLKTQIQAMEKVLLKVREGTDDVYEYVDDSIDVVEKNLRRHERRYDKQDQHLRDVEISVETLKGKVKRLPLAVDTHRSSSSLMEYLFPSKAVRYPPSSSPKYSLHSFTTSSDHLATIPEESNLPSASAPSIIENIPLASIPVRAVHAAISLLTLPLRMFISAVSRTY